MLVKRIDNLYYSYLDCIVTKDLDYFAYLLKEKGLMHGEHLLAVLTMVVAVVPLVAVAVAVAVVPFVVVKRVGALAEFDHEMALFVMASVSFDHT